MTGVVLVFHDVTQRRRATNQLQESEARLRLLSGTAGRLLAAENPQTVVNELCQEVMEHLDCQAFFNFLADESTGRLRLNACAGIPDEEVRKLEWLDYGVAVCGCVARDKQRMIAEDILNSSDPRTNLVKSYGIQAYCCHPLMVQGQLIGTLSFGTRTRPHFSPDDVETMHTVADQVATAMERMQAQAALRAANEQLREADRRKNEFLAMLSHELRNPLAPIRNSLYILERATPGSDQARRAQMVIDRQVGHLSHLVDDLLDLTRISRNKIRLELQPLELNDLVRRTVEDHRLLFEKSEIQIEVRLAPERVSVNADGTRLAQVIGNLLQNAAKFTGHGGRATVSVSVDLAKRQAVIRVSDTGAGIPSELIGRLFQPFMQADTTLDRSKGGLGLGLALVKGLVELHGGDVGVHSDGLGKGAEFVVSLPLAAEGAIAPEMNRGSADHPGRRVLIIEDNIDGADSLREVLQLEWARGGRGLQWTRGTGQGPQLPAGGRVVRHWSARHGRLRCRARLSRQRGAQRRLPRGIEWLRAPRRSATRSRGRLRAPHRQAAEHRTDRSGARGFCLLKTLRTIGRARQPEFAIRTGLGGGLTCAIPIARPCPGVATALFRASKVKSANPPGQQSHLYVGLQAGTSPAGKQRRAPSVG